MEFERDKNKVIVNLSRHNIELRPEYDLRNLRVRKFGSARKQFGNFVKLEPDVAAVFPDDITVNEALRGLIQDTKENGEGRFPIQQPKTK